MKCFNFLYIWHLHSQMVWKKALKLFFPSKFLLLNLRLCLEWFFFAYRFMLPVSSYSNVLWLWLPRFISGLSFSYIDTLVNNSTAATFFNCYFMVHFQIFMNRYLTLHCVFQLNCFSFYLHWIYFSRWTLELCCQVPQIYEWLVIRIPSNILIVLGQNKSFMTYCKRKNNCILLLYSSILLYPCKVIPSFFRTVLVCLDLERDIKDK